MSEIATEQKISLGEKYFNERMQLYKITPEVNQVKLWRNVEHKNTLVPVPVFSACDKGIKIIVYTLDRTLITYKPEQKTEADGEGVIKRAWSKEYAIIRLHTPIIDGKGSDRKYEIPKGAGTYPFFPPQLIDKYDRKQHIKTLVLTEGYFKAFKGAMCGLDIVGLSSITHYKDKETGALHSDILKLIRQCNVQNVIWLADGDCNRISLKALESDDDIYKRPNQFFNSCHNIKRMLDNEDVNKFFAHVDSIGLKGMPKGLDDVLLDFPENSDEIVQDLLNISKPGKWFVRHDITYTTHAIRQYFCLHDVNKFVEFHHEQLLKLARIESPALKEKDFVGLKGKEFNWNGTRYRWNHENNCADIIVPGEAKNYFRVGDQYYEKLVVPNKYGDLDKQFHPRQKQTIVDDYTKEFVKHIPKYKSFCNVPSHSNYQEIIHNCYNMYHPFEHTAAEGECPYTLKFLQHIFGSGTVRVQHKEKGTIEVSELDLGLDYVQLLYQQPQQTLPILCLVSKENNTGKTTLGKWLRLIFTQNVAIVGNQDLSNDFNGHWAGKLVVVCDETKIDKLVVVEKIKSLSTADKMFMNKKGRDQQEIEFFAKFILNSNNEENFIYASDEDQRYWIRKVPVIQELFVGMLDEMREEIPAFLHMLDQRKLKTEKMHRGWFYPELIKTDALRKVIQFSKSTAEKELRENIRNMFFDHGVPEITMTLEAIKEEFFKGRSFERNYLRNVIKDQMKVDYYHEYEYNGVEYKTLDALKAAVEAAGESLLSAKYKTLYKVTRHTYAKWEQFRKTDTGSHETKRVIVKSNGRPFVFHREKFLLPEEVKNLIVDPEMENDIKLAQAEQNNSWSDVAAAREAAAGNGQPGMDFKDDLPF